LLQAKNDTSMVHVLSMTNWIIKYNNSYPIIPATFATKKNYPKKEYHIYFYKLYALINIMHFLEKRYNIMCITFFQ